ncbi:MAG: polysaccharide export protein [Hyphomicrobiales bacterium]|nr:polysaccharide export protein [Hyphomicrobiales bacterium]
MTKTASTLSKFVALVGLCLAVASCDSLSTYVKPAPNDVQAIASAPQTVRLRPGDKAKIVVYGEDKMSGDFEVDANGNVVIPLVGTVHAAGLTKKELQQALKSKLLDEKILRDPSVTVDTAMTRPFYVLGEVEKPGEYTFRNGLDALSAVAVAGGFTYRASKAKILIRRSGESTITEYPLSPDIPVYAGDLISVPERMF